MAPKVKDLTEKQIQYVRDNPDMSINSIAIKFGISPPSLKKRLPEDIIKSRIVVVQRSLSDEQRQFVQDNPKLTYHDFAKHWRLPFSTVSRLLRKPRLTALEQKQEIHYSTVWRNGSDKDKGRLLLNAVNEQLGYSEQFNTYNEVFELCRKASRLDKAKKRNLLDIFNRQLPCDEQFGSNREITELFKRMVRNEKKIAQPFRPNNTSIPVQ